MNLSEIYKPIAKELNSIEEELKKTVNVNTPLLAELLAYAVQSGGKRIRPAFTLFSGKFYNYNLDKLIPMAVGVELLHNATLVHDDIVDNSTLRRGKPTISYAWGKNAALLLGDYLFAKAASFVATTGNLRVIELFAQTLMTISSGELAQINVVVDIKHAREHYFNWISAKTACLFSTATESGAILSDAPEETIKSLKDYGYFFGMAFQIIDDILDFVGKEEELGKPVGSDLIEGALTLPSIIYAESNPDNDLIRKIIVQRDKTIINNVIQEIKKSTIIDECFLIAQEFSQKATEAISILPDNLARKKLIELSGYMLRRKK